MEDIIKKAQEGGYKVSNTHIVMFRGDTMNPLFWQALGKSCGWREPVTANGVGAVKGMQNKNISWETAHALRFHEINLTEGWQSAVEYLQEVTK